MVPAFSVLAIIVPLDVTAPTASDVNIPTDVMFGCAAVDSVPVKVAPALPIVPAFTVLAIIVPAAVSDVVLARNRAPDLIVPKVVPVNTFPVSLPVS